jgi:virginiamycin A acetyltransferase
MENVKIIQTESLKNFLWDIFIRSFECKDALYEDCSVLSDNEKQQLINSYFKNVDIWMKIYRNRVSFIKANVHLSDGSRVLDVEETFFHPKYGWVVANGRLKAFLGKLSFYENVKINIGHRTYFSGHGTIRGGELLQIGNYCAIAEGCYINVFRDSHPMDYPSQYNFNKNYRTIEDKVYLPVKYANLEKSRLGVTIGNDVWFGRNVRIFHGVNIADGCVIAEGALVKKDCVPYGIYGGIPAKLIRLRFPKLVIEQLLEIQWWNWPFSKIKKNATFFDTDLTNIKTDLSNLIVDE